MNLAGLGVVFAGGAGVPALRLALNAHLPLPGEVLEKEKVRVLKVPAEAFAGNPVLATARRADRFCKMTLLAATEALTGCRASPERTGILLATALGPHGTVFKFVNDYLEFGSEQVSPTVFSQSVHTAAVSMVAASANLHGPAMTVADLQFPFEEALMLASAWLESGRCDAVLVGAVDEVSDVLAHVARRKWGTAIVPGEGAVFVRLERGGGPRLTVDDKPNSAVEMKIANLGALGGDDSALVQWLLKGGSFRNYFPLFGNSRIGSALHLAAACQLRAANPAGAIQVVSACGENIRALTLHADDEKGMQ